MKTFRKVLPALFAMLFIMNIANAQTQSYDSKSLVDTNSVSTSISSVNSTNNSTTNNNTTSISTVNSNNTNVNQNIQSGTLTNINQNVNSGSMTYNNNNVNTGFMSYNNNNTSTSTSTNNSASTSNNTNLNIQQGEMTNKNINETMIRQKVEQPPPTAIAPAMMSGGNSDLCTTGISGAAQTQIFGMSIGGTQRDENCERLKLSKTLFDMGMKVAAVATMCQDRRVFDAMMTAGTPCPYEGLIGEQAKEAWAKNPDKMPKPIK